MAETGSVQIIMNQYPLSRTPNLYSLTDWGILSTIAQVVDYIPLSGTKNLATDLEHKGTIWSLLFSEILVKVVFIMPFIALSPKCDVSIPYCC
jgi:hypothetical protein